MRPRLITPIETDKTPRALYVDRMMKSANWFVSQNPETVHITSFDGLDLAAYFLPADRSGKNTGASIILMHGYHSSGIRDFACIYEYFHSLGWNVLLPDERAHGKSGGKYLTFGIKERFDVRDWAAYLDRRMNGKQKLWLMGISMGCTSVLMSLGEKLPTSVRGVIADSGFTRPYEMIKCCIERDFHLFSTPIMPVACFFGKFISHFGFKEYSVPQALVHNTIPVLFVHGNKDGFVPFEMGRKNYDACTARKQFLETSAVHALSFVTETQRYEDTVEEFTERYGS